MLQKVKKPMVDRRIFFSDSSGSFSLFSESSSAGFAMHSTLFLFSQFSRDVSLLNASDARCLTPPFRRLYLIQLFALFFILIPTRFRALFHALFLILIPALFLCFVNDFIASVPKMSGGVLSTLESASRKVKEQEKGG